MKYKQGWDALHDALMLPKVPPRRKNTGEGMQIGVKYQGCLLDDQSHVTLRATDDVHVFMQSLADRILHYEPLLFGWLPIPRGLGITDATVLWSPRSVIRLRYIQMPMGPYPADGWQPWEIAHRFDVLFASGVKRVW
jgi:hypothetical protein